MFWPRRAACRWRACLLLLGWSAGPVLLAAPAAPGISREHEIKAAALYNIVAFTVWPAMAFESPQSPLVVGVLGSGPIASLLGGMVKDETWHGRRVVLQHFKTAAEIKQCHVLYVEHSERGRWPALFPQLRGRPILTVSDEEGFAQQGGVVQFAVDRKKLRLIVNLRSARANGLTISSKVLRLAEIIGDPVE